MLQLNHGRANRRPASRTGQCAAVLIMLVSSTALACLDADGDGVVDMTDLLSVLVQWGSCPASGSCTADANDDGAVNTDDLMLIIDAWGQCESDPGSGTYNYGQALQASVLFYEAQRAGSLPTDSRLSWRGDAFTSVSQAEQVNGSWSVDLSHRYMDAGDTPTFVLPITSAMTLLAWSGIDYEAGYVQSGQLEHFRATLRWHADWCVEAHPEPNVFCGQIGQGSASHAFWLPAEVFPDAYAPKIWWLTPEHPGSEPPAEAAAFLAAASMVFAKSDPAYAQELLSHAVELHSFADQYQLPYHETITDVSAFYRSWSGYQDELCWSALWLYRATGDVVWLDKARGIYDAHFLNGTKTWTHAWDDKSYGCMVLLAAFTGLQVYRDEAQTWLDWWTLGPDSGGIAWTDGGLAWLDTWGSLRYAANTAFMAFAYADLVGDAPDGRYRAFGERQVDYILGDNPRNSSYMCGIGLNPPVRPHHRTGHGSWNDQLTDPQPNRHVLWGALVGGPASVNDFDYTDDRGDWIANEVACDYNAGITAALARMAQVYGGSAVPDEAFPPVEDSYGKEMFVEASVIDDGDTFTRVRCLLNNRSAWPARGSSSLSFRIYVNLSEVFAAGLSVDDVLVDASFTEGASVTGPHAADSSAGLFFVTVDYGGVEISPGPGSSFRRECQVMIGLSSTAPLGAWSRANDPSLASLPLGQGAVVKTSTMPVYDAGALVWGDEGVADCNDNGVDDVDDIAAGAPDLDGNGVPDECDPDCDGDGVPDAWAIMQGADDCNGNGVPDVCDIADGAVDADGDGIPDVCQLDGLTWSMSVSDAWDDGFVAELHITNHSAATIESWLLALHVEFQMDSVWNAVLIGQSDGVAEVSFPAWNDTLDVGEALVIGFQATGPPTPPSLVTVNGATAQPE